MNRIEDLKIWKKSVELCKDVYELSHEIPHNEKYGLQSQIKRSAVSIPSNIAEGAGRNSKKEFKYFLSVANGSAYELHTQLTLLDELKLITKDKLEYVLIKVMEIQKMNYGLQRSLAIT